MLSGEASLYMTTFFRSRRDALLKQREKDRVNVKTGLIHFEDAEKRVGYIGMFQPDCDFLVGLAKAHVEAVQKGYELDGQPITEHVIDREIMPGVEKILRESSAASLSGAQREMRAVQRRTGGIAISAPAKLAGLKRHFDKVVHEARKSIRSEVTLRMLEATKKNAASAKPAAVLAPSQYAFHPEIQRVSQQLFLEGNFRQAVLDAFIHLIATVKQKTELPYDGDDLMNRALSPSDKRTPPVRFNGLSTPEEKDEQAGIFFLFKGVVGMRNYKAHVVALFDDPRRAYEYLSLASLLMRLLDTATIDKPQKGAA
jgi:uncharacterized protein (TIGR02391 family)